MFALSHSRSHETAKTPPHIAFQDIQRSQFSVRMPPNGLCLFGLHTNHLTRQLILIFGALPLPPETRIAVELTKQQLF